MVDSPHEFLPASIPPLLLYAETHFRFFPLFPSLLFRRQPEVIFDVPRRIDPGADLPIILIINDIHRFPAQLVDVQISVARPGKPPRLITGTGREIDHPLRFQSSAYLFQIPREELETGEVTTNAKAVLRCGKRLIMVLNDNLYGTTKAPFTCFVSDTPLPGKERCVYGDLHVHSQFSQSHVEFGPPIPLIAHLARLSGLDFISITDHSYDLACSLDDYLHHSDGSERWEAYLQEVDKTSTPGLIIIPGEEISCMDGQGKTVHLCAYGTRSYIPGSHDGARRNARKIKQLSIHDATDEIHAQGGAAFAAHPGNLFGALQRLFLGRGRWRQQDLNAPIDGLQAANGRFKESWIRARKLWVDSLLRGGRLPIIGGSDAHGDFNRYRAITVPFLRIADLENHFAHVRTGIYGRPRTVRELIQALRQGRTFVSSGPFLDICRTPREDSSLVSTFDTSLSDSGIFVEAISSYELGPLRLVRLIAGESGAERVVWTAMPRGEEYEVVQKIDRSQLPKQGYLRAEAMSRGREGQEEGLAFTSCCFLAN